MAYTDEYLAKWGKYYEDHGLELTVLFSVFIANPENYLDYHDFTCQGCSSKVREFGNLCASCQDFMSQGGE